MKKSAFKNRSKIPGSEARHLAAGECPLSVDFFTRASVLARFWFGAPRHYTKNIMPARTPERFQKPTFSFQGEWMYRGGFGVIEAVVACALAAAALVGFAQAASTAVRLLRREQNIAQATLLAREALEAVRSARDESWAANIAWRTGAENPSLRYYPTVVADTWSLATTSPGLVNGVYERYVVFEKVGRDSQDRIVSSGGADDPGTRKVTATASSTGQSVSLVSYITDFQSYLGPPAEANAISFENAASDGDLDTFPSANAGDGDPAQGFTTGSAISVSRVALLLRRATAAPSDIYAEIRTTAAGIVLGTSQTIFGSSLASTSPAWVDFRFLDPVALAAATKYYIRLRSVPSSTDAGSGSAGAVYWDYTQQVPSGPYAGGEARRFVGRLSNPADAGAALDQYDFGFRIYAVH